jgi:hypothetical protein
MLVGGVLVGVALAEGLVEGEDVGAPVGATLVEGLVEGEGIGVPVAVGLAEGLVEGEEVGVLVAVALGEVVFVVALGKGNGANSKVLAICTNPLSDMSDILAAVMFTSLRGMVTPATEPLIAVPFSAAAIWVAYKAVWEVIAVVEPMEVRLRTVWMSASTVVKSPWVVQCRNWSLGVSPTM